MSETPTRPDAHSADALAAARSASRLWARDLALFAADTDLDLGAAISQRLGWLDAPAAAAEQAPDVQAFADAVRRDGLTEVYLLGMGGSSLVAEVLRDVPGDRRDPCRLAVLDTTDERAIRTATEGLVADRALFLVASKSGGTIEVTALERHFWEVLSAQIPSPGRHFVAITDPGTPLQALANRRGYRHTFVNAADIGGRYSALSLFGLVPAALLGLDVAAFVEAARAMADRCRVDATGNPGLALGAFMATESAARRDKLTLLMPAELAALGTWIEQLVAESTGKDGRGVLPIVGEPMGSAAEYGPDRAFVAIGTTTSGPIGALVRDLEREGRPVFRIDAGPRDLGAEFFRWEFATALAGAALGINPFDEPNVREAKTRTLAQLDARASSGTFRLDPPYERGPGYSRREWRPARPQPAGRRRYVALLDYLPSDPYRGGLFSEFRAALRRRVGLATTHGIGPRYLHSTGQFHKGGPNTGVFVLLTAVDASATPIPGTDYTFSTLKLAQALGDFDALAAADRTVVHYHLDDPTADFSTTLERLLAQLDR
jgi:glucose-6-phosphate isomerase